LVAHYDTFLDVVEFGDVVELPSQQSRSARRSWVVRAGAGAVALGLISVLIFVSPLHGQRDSRSRASPHETVSSVVDGANISVTYGRPSMRGRKIFGALLPYERVWMPGADEATIFQTSARLRFDDFTLPAGSYTLYTIPSQKRWTLIINKMTGQFHTYYPEDQDLAKLPMAFERLSTPVEQLTISAVPRPQGGGAIQLEWETTRVSAPFSVLR
jgi:Protein of unknown function (DUF2911)